MDGQHYKGRMIDSIFVSLMGVVTFGYDQVTAVLLNGVGVEGYKLSTASIDPIALISYMGIYARLYSPLRLWHLLTSAKYHAWTKHI